jgi:hypothetical protein
MLSVLVLALQSSKAAPPTAGKVVGTLAALVPPTMEGLVRDVTLVAVPPSDQLAKVADHAGCALFGHEDSAAAIESAARQCRCASVLVLEAGIHLERAFWDEMASIFVVAQREPNSRLVKGVQGSVASRLVPSFAPTVGVLTSRALILSGPTRDLSSLARRSGAKSSFRSRASRPE